MAPYTLSRLQQKLLESKPQPQRMRQYFCHCATAAGEGCLRGGISIKMRFIQNVFAMTNGFISFCCISPSTLYLFFLSLSLSPLSLADFPTLSFLSLSHSLTITLYLCLIVDLSLLHSIFPVFLSPTFLCFSSYVFWSIFLLLSLCKCVRERESVSLAFHCICFSFFLSLSLSLSLCVCVCVWMCVCLCLCLTTFSLADLLISFSLFFSLSFSLSLSLSLSLCVCVCVLECVYVCAYQFNYIFSSWSLDLFFFLSLLSLLYRLSSSCLSLYFSTIYNPLPLCLMLPMFSFSFTHLFSFSFSFPTL